MATGDTKSRKFKHPCRIDYHINYYLAGLLSAFETGRLEISDKYSFELPSITSEADWNNLKATFLDNAEKFAIKVEQFLTSHSSIQNMEHSCATLKVSSNTVITISGNFLDKETDHK